MKYIKEPLNEYDEIQKQLLFQVFFVYPYCVFMDACFVLFLLCLSTCGCVGFQVQSPLRECPRLGASGLRYYCTPLVCVPAVLGGLAAWQHNNDKKKPLGASNFPISPHHFSYVVECFERH